MLFDWNTETNLIRMYGVIGEFYDEISAEDLIRAFDEMDGGPVTIQLKSPGGEIDDGLSMYGTIREYPGAVTVEVDAQAASIATVFPMAADKVLMRPRSELFIHDPWTIAMGNASEFRRVAEYLDALGMEIAQVYAEKAGGDPEEWFNTMRDTKRYSAEHAVEVGLADGITGKPEPEDSGKMLTGAAQPVARVGFVSGGGPLAAAALRIRNKMSRRQNG